MTIDLTTMTLREAMAGLDAGDFNVLELARETFLRLRATDPEVHAWVQTLEENALQTALFQTRARPTLKKRSPLTGLPIGIKDILDVAGVPTRCGTALLADAPPAHRDAEVVHRLRRDGAIFMGKTVTQEFAAGVVSAPCRNPWDLDRIPGGSSGGSAAAVAIGSCLGAIGSDTGGSIRIPAALTGTVGLKPTYGRLPMSGIYPLAPSLDTPGPITRSVADAVLLYLSITNRTAEVQQLDERLTPFGSQPLAGVRIGVLEGYFVENIQPDVVAAYEIAVTELANLGADLIPITWDDAAVARSIASLINRAESAAIHHDHIRAEEADLLGSEGRSRFEAGALLPASSYLRAMGAREVIRASIARLWGRFQLDVMVAPAVAATAPLAGSPVVDFPDGPEGVGHALTRLTMPWNATGQPVISVPCGFDHDDLPIGLAFIGRPDDDLGICRIAHQYEEAARWFKQAAASA
jgi:Asp-tRNA(Asn)/Glu-tRNA(Gln) amidotransferase A subunit family amidase